MGLSPEFRLHRDAALDPVLIAGWMWTLQEKGLPNERPRAILYGLPPTPVYLL